MDGEKWVWSVNETDVTDDAMTDEDDELINEVGGAEVRLGVVILEIVVVSEMVEFSSYRRKKK